MTYDPGIPLLEHVANELPRLRKSERRVAEIVTENPALVVGSTMAAVAEAAGVSEPTVMRFCTSLGFDGFQQFKLALAQSVALGMPATLSTIRPDDSIADLATKVFDHTISSLDRSRRYLDFARIEEAVGALLAAESIIVAGLGASGIIALDVEQKAVLFGIPCSAPSDPHQQFMAAAMARPGSVLIAVSNTGGTKSIVEIASTGQAAGAVVIGLTGDPDNPLATIVDIPLVVRTFEDTDTVTPTVSRIASLVVVDVLATAVSLRRGQPHGKQLAEMKEKLATFRRGELQ